MDQDYTENFWHIKPDKRLALELAKRQLPEFVCDAVNLEGINVTLPEVQTLLDGITIGGHQVSDQQIILNQGKAWKFLFDLVKQDKYRLSKEIACDLHNIAAKEDALTWGKFRDSGVYIAGTEYLPPEAEKLPELFTHMIGEAQKIRDIYQRSFYVFLNMARNQYFHDVNKRMGRFMMNGLLLSEGFPAVNIPAKKQLEFNQKMIRFYESNKQDEMVGFLRSCMDRRIVNIMKQSQRSVSM